MRWNSGLPPMGDISYINATNHKQDELLNIIVDYSYHFIAVEILT